MLIEENCLQSPLIVKQRNRSSDLNRERQNDCIQLVEDRLNFHLEKQQQQQQQQQQHQTKKTRQNTTKRHSRRTQRKKALTCCVAYGADVSRCPYSLPGWATSYFYLVLDHAGRLLETNDSLRRSIGSHYPRQGSLMRRGCIYRRANRTIRFVQGRSLKPMSDVCFHAQENVKQWNRNSNKNQEQQRLYVYSERIPATVSQNCK